MKYSLVSTIVPYGINQGVACYKVSKDGNLRFNELLNTIESITKPMWVDVEPYHDPWFSSYDLTHIAEAASPYPTFMTLRNAEAFRQFAAVPRIHRTLVIGDQHVDDIDSLFVDELIVQAMSLDVESVHFPFLDQIESTYRYFMIPFEDAECGGIIESNVLELISNPLNTHGWRACKESFVCATDTDLERILSNV